MNELQIIEQRELLGKEFRIYGDIENPLFLAKNVAQWIEYEGRSGQMLNTVDDTEKLTHTIYASGQNREMWFLTEDGLYEVLMQSRKPIAKEFKKQVKEILKSIRKTGGYVANEDLFVNTYLPYADDTTKQMFKSTLLIVRSQNETIQKQQKEIRYKEDIIIGLVDDITLAEKRQILNRVVRKTKNGNYAERYNELYKQFEDKYHCNLTRRFEHEKDKHKPKIKNKMDYIDRVMRKIPELYEIATKLYENDVKILVNELYEVNR